MTRDDAPRPQAPTGGLYPPTVGREIDRPGGGGRGRVVAVRDTGAFVVGGHRPAEYTANAWGTVVHPVPLCACCTGSGWAGSRDEVTGAICCIDGATEAEADAWAERPRAAAAGELAPALWGPTLASILGSAIDAARAGDDAAVADQIDGAAALLVGAAAVVAELCERLPPRPAARVRARVLSSLLEDVALCASRTASAVRGREGV